MPLVVRTAKGRSGLYQADIVLEPAANGFKATILKVLLLRPPSPVGTEVTFDGVAEHSAKSREEAELLATLQFNAWAKVKG